MPKEAPPATATDALVWAKEAMASSRSLVDPHVGTSWRIIGADHNGEEISIGVETFVEPLGGPVLLLTVF